MRERAERGRGASDAIGIRLRIAVLVALVATVGVVGVSVATTQLVARSAQDELRRLSQENAVGDGQATGSQTIIERSDSFIIVSGATDFGPISSPIEGSAGTRFLTAFTPTGGLDEAVEALSEAFWVGGPLLIVVLTVAAWVLAGRALRPVSDIVDRTRRITSSNLHERVPVPAGRDELTELAETMNEMLDRVEVGAARQRRFVSDASHELRSPLTALIGEVEIALAHPEASAWPDTAIRVLQQADRLEQLVAEFLEASTELEASERSARDSRAVDLPMLIRQEVDWLSASMPSSVSTRVEAALAPLWVPGDESSLRSAVRNLLSNASRHAESEIVIRVDCGSVHEVVTLTVDDDGPGVAEGDRETIFERFTRLDEARAGDRGGAGLGLAIVRSIAERHGGRCLAERSPLGGARFRLELPAYSSMRPELAASER